MNNGEIPSLDGGLDDDAIRSELLKIVADHEGQLLAQIQANKQEITTEAQSLNVSEAAIATALAQLDRAKLSASDLFQKMRDFIQRQ